MALKDIALSCLKFILFEVDYQVNPDLPFPPDDSYYHQGMRRFATDLSHTVGDWHNEFKGRYMKTILGLLLACGTIVFFIVVIVISYITCILVLKEQFAHNSTVITNHFIGWFIIMLSIVIGTGGAASLVYIKRLVFYKLINLQKLPLPDSQKF